MNYLTGNKKTMQFPLKVISKPKICEAFWYYWLLWLGKQFWTYYLSSRDTVGLFEHGICATVSGSEIVKCGCPYRDCIRSSPRRAWWRQPPTSLMKDDKIAPHPTCSVIASGLVYSYLHSAVSTLSDLIHFLIRFHPIYSIRTPIDWHLPPQISESCR